MPVYRELTLADIPQMAELYRLAGWLGEDESSEYIAKILTNGTCHWLGAFEGKVLAGMARALCDHASDAFIHDVTVRPQFRRRGIASELVKRLTRIVLAEGVDWLGLVGAPNTRRLYEACNFATLENYTPMRYRPEE